MEAFLTAMPGASVYALREGFKSAGATDNQTVLIMETLMDSKSLFLTPNTETVYNLMWLDLKDGPLVVETPPNVLGMIDDHWFKYVGDFGNAGPDKGKGGKFLLLPPGYKGEAPEGCFVFRTPTFGNVLFWRGFVENGSTRTAVENSKKFARVYPLAQVKNPPPMKFVNVSGKEFNTIHANDFHFYEEVYHIVQEEPNEALNPETLGLFAAIGMSKGKPFAAGVDRTVLPIAEPDYPRVTELDARKATPPPRFEVKVPEKARNVVIVLIDDIGFGHSAAFGGPISMPMLDRLAANGLRFNRFHTTALCSPTRVALLAGRNHHVNNAGAIMELATAFQGNTGVRPNSVAPLAEKLRLNGYGTAAFGKYHETAPWEDCCKRSKTSASWTIL